MNAATLSTLTESSVLSPATAASVCRNIAETSVLMTDESYKHSLGIMRQLGRLGARVSVIAYSSDSLVCRSRYCREIIRSVAPTIPAYLEATLQAVKRNHYDLLMPVSFPMTLAFARNRENLTPHVNLELAGSAEIELAANKMEMVHLANKVGVPTPKSKILSGIDELEIITKEMNFPVVVKPLKESRKGVVAYARTFGELRNICSERLAGEIAGTWEKQLVQEFIPGCGYGFFATYQKGVCKRVFMHRRVREYPADGGASSCAESFHDPRLEDYGRRMLDALHWHGVAMVEFRRDNRDGDYKLIEVNPKFWGSIDLALAAGADFPGDVCRMSLGCALPFTDSYQRNLRFQWPLSGHGDLFHLWTRPKAFFEVGLDFLNPKVKSNLWWTDLGPNVQELRALAGSFLRMRKV